MSIHARIFSSVAKRQAVPQVLQSAVYIIAPTGDSFVTGRAAERGLKLACAVLGADEASWVTPRNILAVIGLANEGYRADPCIGQPNLDIKARW